MRARPAHLQEIGLLWGVVPSVFVAALLALAGQVAGGGVLAAGAAAGSNVAAAGFGPGIVCCGYVSISNVVIQVSSSNLNTNNTVTISFSTSPSGTHNSIYWGLNPTYSGYESGNASLGTSTIAVLQYMNPGTTFNVSIVASYEEPGVEWYPGEYSGHFSTPGSSSTDFVGYVLASGDNPIGHASVNATWSGGGGTYNCPTPSATYYTAPNGSFSLPIAEIFDAGDICMLQTLSAWAPSHWTEEWNDPNFGNGTNLNSWQAFRLLPNGVTSSNTVNSYGDPNGAYNVAAFVHTSSAYCTLNSGLSDTSSVYAYLGGSGFTDTQSFTLGTTFPGPGTSPLNNTSLGVAGQYYTTGVYELESTGAFDVLTSRAIGIPPVQSSLIITGSDPVSSPPAPGATSTGYAQIETIPLHTTEGVDFYASGSFTLQFGLDVSVSVGFSLGVEVSVSATLNVGASGTQTSFAGTSCQIGSPSATSTQYYEVYAQGGSSVSSGIEYHIWACEAGPASGSDPTCVPD